MELEQLNFKLIIDDTEFNQKIAEVKRAAEELNINISKILDIKKKVTATSDKDVENAKRLNKILKDNARAQEMASKAAARAAAANKKVAETAESDISRVKALNREREAQAALKTAEAQMRLNRLQNAGLKDLIKTSSLWTQIASMMGMYFSVMGATRLVRNLVEVSAEFELQRTTLRAILQDAEGADRLFSQIKDLAVKSPFSFKELATYAEQLSAYSIPVKELYSTTKMLADMSAGLGVGMDRLVLAYGQIRSAAFLRGFGFFGLSASKGVKNTNPFNCWDSYWDNQQPRCFAA